MKYLNFSKLLCFFVISGQIAFADTCDNNIELSRNKDNDVVTELSIDDSDTMIAKGEHKKNILMTSGFVSGVDEAYPVDLPANLTPQPISLERNFGEREGEIKFIPKGVKIEESGDYWINFSIDLVNQSAAEDIVIQVIAKQNDDFNQNDPLNVSGFTFIPSSTQSNNFATIQASGILKNVKKKTTVTLVGVNGSGGTRTITVGGWKISVFKIER